MPIYEYRCSACGHELETLQKLSEAPLVKCPACAKDTLTKLLSAAGFQLKGSGWYATDFKGSGSKPAAKLAADKAGDGKTADGKAGDAKPAGASESKSDAASETKAAPAATPIASTSSGTGTSST